MTEPQTEAKDSTCPAMRCFAPRFSVNEVVGLRGHVDHCFGRVILGDFTGGRWRYLLDESPHAISDYTAWVLVANATDWGSEDRPDGQPPLKAGLAMYVGWWPETKLKKRKPGIVCQCKLCAKFRRKRKGAK